MTAPGVLDSTMPNTSGRNHIAQELGQLPTLSEVSEVIASTAVRCGAAPRISPSSVGDESPPAGEAVGERSGADGD